MLFLLTLTPHFPVWHNFVLEEATVKSPIPYFEWEGQENTLFLIF